MKIIQLIKEIEEWFNERFAWFFTNGMKALQEAERNQNKDFRA
jgi:hypothetical protein